MNQLDTINYLIITHGIKGMKYHFFCDYGIYQISHCPRKRTLPEMIIKKMVIGLCRGYKIDGKFYSLTALERLMFPFTKVLLREEKYDCPF